MDLELHQLIQTQLVEETVIRNIFQKNIRINQIRDGLDKIAAHAFADGIFSIYPTSSKPDGGVRSILEARLKTLASGAGLGMVYRSLAVLANLNIQHPCPDEILYDVCLLRQNHPTVILTVIPNDVKDIQSNRRYNLSVTKKLIESIRRFTSHNFSAVYGLLKESDLQTDKQFADSLERIVESKSKFCIPCSLDMPGDKYRSIVSALLSSIACTDIICSETVEAHDTVWLLTSKQFSILTECIDKDDVHVKTSQSCGGRILLLEVANRLEKCGPSLIISSDPKVMKIANERNMKIFVPSGDKKVVMTGGPVDNIISNSTSFSRQQLRQQFPNIQRLWIFEKDCSASHSAVEIKDSTSFPRREANTPNDLTTIDKLLARMIRKIGPFQEQRGRKNPELSKTEQKIKQRMKRARKFRL